MGMHVCRTITYASDYFPGMVEIAKKMIKAGHMYADNTDVETMRTERMACTLSKNRDQQPDETLRIFEEEMLMGTTVRCISNVLSSCTFSRCVWCSFAFPTSFLVHVIGRKQKGPGAQ